MSVTRSVLAASIPTVTGKAPPVVEIAVPASGSDVLRQAREAARKLAGVEIGRQHAVDPARHADVEDDRLAGDWHQAQRSGSLTVPLKVGSDVEVMLSPTMLVSLAGSRCSDPGRTAGGVVLMMNESKKFPPG